MSLKGCCEVSVPANLSRDLELGIDVHDVFKQDVAAWFQLGIQRLVRPLLSMMLSGN